MAVDKKKDAESELQPEREHKPKLSAKESESHVIIDIKGSIISFCNKADESLKPIKNLHEVLDDLCYYKHEDSDAADQLQIAIARRLLDLIADRINMLGAEAEQSSADLEEMSKAIESGSWAARCAQW